MELNWEDIKKIVAIADELIDLDVMDELPGCCETEEGYYTEIRKKKRRVVKPSFNYLVIKDSVSTTIPPS